MMQQESSTATRSQGALVDRLLVRIGALEAQLYSAANLGDSEFTIPAIHATPPSPHTAAAAAAAQLSSRTSNVNLPLLDSLGDPDKPARTTQQEDQQQQQQPPPNDWLSSMPSWISSRTSAARASVSEAGGSGDVRKQPAASPQSSTPPPVDAAESRGSGGSSGNSSSLRSPRPASSPPPQAARSRQSAVVSAASSASASSASTSGGRWGGLKKYFQPPVDAAESRGSGYAVTPAASEKQLNRTADDDDESDMLQRVHEAAGAALAEANERLLETELRVQAAQAAQAQAQERLEQALQDLEQLKSENLEAWREENEAEVQLASCRATLAAREGQACCMQQELRDLRQQAQIRSNSSNSEGDKLKAEVDLLNAQLVARSQEALEERDRMQQQFAAASAAAVAASASAADCQERFMRERAVRRRLHEQLQVLRGNIRVLCRTRPLQLSSKQQPAASTRPSGTSCISFPLEGLLVVNDVVSARPREFEFDAVFGPDSTQQQMFEEVSGLVRSCADGCNCTILAYGQTGSGKTHTMEGPADDPGINSRALQELFRIAAEEGRDEPGRPWSFNVAMLEIYNEAVFDLLGLAASPTAAGSSHSVSGSLDVSGLPAGELPAHVDRVPGLVWRPVSCTADVHAVLREGWHARATAATALNAASSRSHAVLCVKVRGARERQPFTSVLYLVDLAGSERVDKSEVTGQQLKEAQAINKSLSALGDVIAALQRRGAHIPFRNSKLTQVLQDSLCGSSKVLLVCNLSPEAASCSETLSSLNFASRAAQVDLGQARRAAAASPQPDDAASSSALDGGGSSVRPRSPASSQRGSGSGGGVSNTAGGGGPGSPTPGLRPVSRLSERSNEASGGGLAPASSPRVSGGSAKPARH